MHRKRERITRLIPVKEEALVGIKEELLDIQDEIDSTEERPVPTKEEAPFARSSTNTRYSDNGILAMTRNQLES